MADKDYGQIAYNSHFNQIGWMPEGERVPSWGQADDNTKGHWRQVANAVLDAYEAVQPGPGIMVQPKVARPVAPRPPGGANVTNG